jgi:serine/threonine protein kinase/tetratricopeptide (TPR) repeat protein
MSEREVFIAALQEGDPARRRAYLDAACAGQPDLRHQVEHLLRLHAGAGSFLEQPAAEVPPTGPLQEAAEQTSSGEAAGARLGPYKLLEQVGEGGMGTVWLAQQTEPVRRLVAVKLIKAGMDSKQVLARFEAERQALALMDHPHIARVLDGGTTTGEPGGVSPGRPYFVMDLVKGVPITRYCDAHRLTPRQRLELFVPVCRAVQHAHQKGIIHRDLKPSNVLVALCDGRPVPKVIDFGVAKAAGQPLTEKTLVTGFGALVGTPEYMSPEQAELNQLDVDTRSDIYSLGVLLYELLTGSPPFSRRELERGSVLEMLRAIREQEPTKPSAKLSTAEGLPTLAANRGTEPAKLTRLVRGELDWVVMKCLEKDRSRRYETANGLAMDVQRYLVDEPVLACPPSAGYRFRKSVRRHKGPVLAASLVFLALVFGVIGTTAGLVRAERARQGEEQQRHAAEAAADRAVQAQERAEQGFAKAKEAVEHYLNAVTEDPDLKHKHDLRALRKRLLEAAVPFYQWFAEQKPGEAALERERGQAYWRLAFVRSELGETEAARKDYERMQATFDRLAADFPAVPAYRRELAASYYNLGNQLADLGQRAAAERAYRRALEIRAQLAADFPAVPAYRWALARSHNSLGVLLADLRQRPAAERAYRQALDIEEKLVADFPTVPEYRRDLAASHTNLGNLLKDLGRQAEAERVHRRALDLREQLAADFPTVPEHRQELATSHNSLGTLLADLGRRPAAEKAYRRALDIQEKLATDFPSVPEYRRDLATSHSNLGHLLKDVGQRPEAERAYRRTLDLREKLAADFPAVPAYRQALVRIHTNLGVLLTDLGRRPEAERAYRRALEIQEKLSADFPAVPENRQQLAMCHNSLGNLLAELGRRPEAERAYRRALEIREKLAADFPAVPEYHRDLARSHNSLGNLLANLARKAEAERAYRRALEIRERLTAHFPAVPEYRRDLAGSSVNFGHLLGEQGQTEASLAWYAKAIALLEPLVQQEPRLVMERYFLRNAHWSRAEALDEMGRPADAVKDWDRALALNAVPANVPGIRSGRAQSLARAGEHAKAVAEASALAEAKDMNGGTLYDLACVCALAAAAVKDDANLQAQYAARAVELLAQAVAKGFKDAARMKKDKDLDVLRDREDFGRLVAELEAKKP